MQKVMTFVIIIIIYAIMYSLNESHLFNCRIVVGKLLERAAREHALRFFKLTFLHIIVRSAPLPLLHLWSKIETMAFASPSKVGSEVCDVELLKDEGRED